MTDNNHEAKPASVTEYSDESKVPQELVKVLEEHDMSLDFSKDVTSESVSRQVTLGDVSFVIRIDENNNVFYVREIKPQ